MDQYSCDILVLGAGLSGLRAAWAAAEYAPELSIAVMGNTSEPSGSSFSNRNNALGILYLDNSDAQMEFVKEAEAIASPGFMDKRLLPPLARESAPRVQDMIDLGVKFRTGPDNELIRHASCGSKSSHALIFDELAKVHALFTRKIKKLRIRQFQEHTVLGLLHKDGQCSGAWGMDGSKKSFKIPARAVIMALGGPAPLFFSNICGPHISGYSLGLMQEIGVKTANESHIQFMWYDHKGNFINPANLLKTGKVLSRNASPVAADIDDRAFEMRKNHCPLYYNTLSYELDKLLLKNMNLDGWCRVRKDNSTIRLAPTAHAGNGGAEISDNGATTVQGLYAVGECATGMHGANRLGGAMILATQVFGKRAGVAAAKACITGKLKLRETSQPKLVFNDSSFAQDAELIKGGMQKHCLPENRRGLPNLLKALDRFTTDDTDRRIALKALSAQAIARHALSY